MKKYSILVVDDEAIVRHTVASDLEYQGYKVTMAESGEEALSLLQNPGWNMPVDLHSLSYNSGSDEPYFDLVITDLLMEGMDGIQVLKKIKEITPGTMVIILTGHGSLATAIDALRLYADDYILKPCDVEVLNFRVSRCLERLEFQRKVKLYEKLLPVCCVCKKIRDDAGKEPGTGGWMEMDDFLRERAKVDISHGYCPECAEKMLREVGI